MKKKLLCLFMVCLVAGTSWGQSISKQINDIKRSSQYVCAEATMESEAQAYELAEELLSQQISEFASTQKSLKNAPNVIVKNVAGKAEKLQMNRGAMTRVFLYVKKSDIIAADNTRVLVQQPATESEATGETGKQLVTTVERLTSPENAAAEQPAASQQSAAKDAGSVNAAAASARDRVVADLLGCQTAAEAKDRMTRLRVEQVLKRYGSADNCPDPANSLWLIFDEQGMVVTVLGEGAAERMNYRTMAQDALSNYKGMGAIWFTLTK